MKKKDRIESLWTALWRYIRKPDYSLPILNGGLAAKTADIFRYWSLGIVIALLAAYLSSVFINSAGLDDSQNLLEDFFEGSPALLVIVAVFFWGPLSEEIAFRLALRYSPYNLGYFLSFLSYFLFEVALSFFPDFFSRVIALMDRVGPLLSLAALASLIVILGFIFGFLLSRSGLSRRISLVYEHYFPTIFFASSLLFAFVHFYNYANFKELWLALPFLIAPQFLLGLILSFIRMRYGFIWAVFYHSLHNSLTALPALLFSQVSPASIEKISQGGENLSLDLPLVDMAYYLGGVAGTFFLFLLTLILFVMFINDHYRFKNGRKEISE
jgi:membrane protease YdiL (CAAX protease family)